MSLPVFLRAEASQDVEIARDYLEEEQAGLGQKFLKGLHEVLGRISSAPEMYGKVKRDVRAARLRRFTYVV